MQQSIVVKNLHKKFAYSLKRSFVYGFYDLCNVFNKEELALRKSEFWALRDISFSVKPGQCLGIIGHNGAGKTTLLNILNGVYRPTAGSVTLNGRVGSLIQLGAGFNPLLSGRENILVNASVLGLSRKQTLYFFDEIVEFADIGDFIDAPVQIYSSGMKIRLGFSIASQINPDIFLIDEVLSVGDISFRQRCYERMIQLRKSGKAIVFISHNTSVVESLCDDCILLEKGQVSLFDKVDKVVSSYEEMAIRKNKPKEGGVDKYKVDGLVCELKNDNSSLNVTFTLINIGEQSSMSSAKIIVMVKKDVEGSPVFVMSSTGWRESDLVLDKTSNNLDFLLSLKGITSGKYSVFVGVQGSLSAKAGQKWLMSPKKYAEFQINDEENSKPYLLEISPEWFLK